jgi:hypothetical protein
VQYILTGTVRWSKEHDVNRVRVTPELIDVTNESSKWSQPYDTVLSNVFEVQAGIASRVAEALNVALAAPAQERIARRPTASLDAYDQFLKGEQITKSLGTSDGITLMKGLEHYGGSRRQHLRAGVVRRGASQRDERRHIADEGVGRRAKFAAQRVARRPRRGSAGDGGIPAARGAGLPGARTQYLEGLKRDASNADLLVGLATLERALGASTTR